MENNNSSSSLLACPLFWIDAFKPQNEWSVGPKSGGEIKNSEAGEKEGEGVLSYIGKRRDVRIGAAGLPCTLQTLYKQQKKRGSPCCLSGEERGGGPGPTHPRPCFPRGHINTMKAEEIGKRKCFSS